MSGQGVWRSGRWAFLAVAAALMALSRVHLGLRHDARLYFGDALARLDPQGVGQDLIFAHDGQFGFSLYTPLLAGLVRGLGLDTAVALVSGLGLILWLAALMLLMSRLLIDLPVVWRRAATVLVIAAAPYYGAHEVFAYGEAFATPRILVEAVGMVALTAWLFGRRWLAAGLLMAGLVLHPIMALCGLAVLIVALCLEDRRWLLAAIGAAVALAVAALLGLPVAERLLRIMDPAWLSISQDRSPTVFVSLWPAEACGRMAVQGVTLGLAARLSQGPARRLMMAVLIAGFLGVILAWTADRLSLVLPIQIQAWRTLALMAVLAAAGLAVCVRELATRGPSGVMTLSALIVGWTFVGWGAPALCAAAVALLTVLLGERGLGRDARRVSAGMLGLATLLVLLWLVIRLTALHHALAALPAGQGAAAGLIWNSGAPGWIAAAVALTLAMQPSRLSPWPARAGAGLMVVLALLLWDSRSDFVRARDAGADPQLGAILARHPGEVLWLAGDVEPWLLAQRPSWASKFQGAGVVLSRPLAMALGARIDRLIDLGLVGEDWKRPFAGVPATPRRPAAWQVASLCQDRDAPVWIVAPLATKEALDPDLDAEIWLPRAPYGLELGGRWFTASRYAVIPCAGR